MRALFWAMAILGLLSSVVQAAPTPAQCAAWEAAGRINVSCYGANAADDGDAIFLATCHLLRGNPLASKTMFFPAGEWRANTFLGWDAGVPTLHSVVYEGEGRDVTALVKDPSLPLHGGTWSLYDGQWRQSLDPDTCWGDWLYDWDTGPASIGRRNTLFFMVGNNAAVPPDIIFKDLTVTRSVRVFPVDNADDEGARYLGKGSLTFIDARLSKFALGTRSDWGPPGGPYAVSQPRPQRFVATGSSFEDMVLAINGDGTFIVQNNTFIRVGTGVAANRGLAMYLKRVPAVVVENNTFSDGLGYVLCLDNDHASDNEPAFYRAGSFVRFTGNQISNHLSSGDVILSNVNNALKWTVSDNSFSGTGFLKWFNRVTLTFQGNIVSGIGWFVNYDRPTLDVRPVMVGNRFTSSFIYARTVGFTSSGNSVQSTGVDVVTTEPQNNVGNIYTGTVPVGGTVTVRYDGANYISP